MGNLRRGFCFLTLLLICSSVTARGTRKWRTLTGDPPLVIARGGFSGQFADSSSLAYNFALLYGLPNLHVWCNVQLTKDGSGICFTDINLGNSSNIANVFPDRNGSYTVAGKEEPAWFAADFTLKELSIINLQQGIYRRSPFFDSTPMNLQTVGDVISLRPPGLWLNFENVAFFRQHNLSMTSFAVSISRNSTVDYISSTDLNFLTSVSKLGIRGTKLVFRFLGPDEMEPSTNRTYESLKNNLTYIKTIANGILVPKTYIWPVDRSYLTSSSSLVLDAHKSGLAVFASDFVNDLPLPYNYSYDPVNEYRKFIDNDLFSVDGFLSSFPLTSSASIDCFSHISKNDTVQEKFLIMSNEGASGDYPGCSDFAYNKAVSDGVDILDCPVQVTSDGIPFCLGSINVKEKTDAAQSLLSDRATSNTDLNITDGIFSYNLTWKEIQSLHPQISNPYYLYNIFRDPNAGSGGKLMQLSKFLSFANNASSLTGVIITIQNGVYLTEKLKLGVTDIVLDALSKAGYNNQTTKKVMIQSNESAVLKKFRSESTYELVYVIEEDVGDISNDSILEMKKFANAVRITKKSVFPSDSGVLKGETKVVEKLQASNLSVYVGILRNEFVSQAWDFFADPYVEVNTYTVYKGINGVVTDYPATSDRFRRNRCLGYKKRPNYMTAVPPGGLLRFMLPPSMPPAEAPNPMLNESDVVEPPLPPVPNQTQSTPGTGNSSTASAQSPGGNGAPRLVSRCILFSIIVSIVCSAVLL